MSRLIVLLCVGLNLFAQTQGDGDDVDASAQTVTSPPERYGERKGFHWGPAVRETFLLLSMEHSFRMTQKKTRVELGGRFFPDWFNSVSNLHGWNDGDSIGTNYVGHSMHSSWVGFIQIQNDPIGKKLEFGNTPEYWHSRLKAFAWSTAYEIQWHLGPISEASIGHVGKKWGTLGYVNLASSSVGGTGLVILEDAIDKYVISRLERGDCSPPLKRFYRSAMNPSRGFANILRFRRPWYRDSRSM